MTKSIYILAREYIENKGSYAGFIEEFAKFASERGYRVIILCGQTKKSQKNFEKLPYAEVYRFSLPKFKMPLIGMNLDYLSLAFHVKNYFRKFPVMPKDIIIANGRSALGVLNKCYTLRVGQPAFTFLRNMDIAKMHVSFLTRIARLIHFLFQYFLEMLCLRKASALLLASHETGNLWLQYYGKKEIPFFIPFSGIKVSKLEKGGKSPILGKKILFISAGEEKIRKGVIYLEKILPEIFEKFRDVKLIHVGEKFSWNVPEEYKERIISVGKVPWEKMKDYYASADVFVSCSLNEGFPNAILEAMAAGCPIVSSDIEGIREYITHLKEGYIYRRGDYNALKEGIIYMLENPKEREEMAKRAKEKVKKLDYSIYSEKLLEFLENVKEGKAKSVNLLESD